MPPTPSGGGMLTGPPCDASRSSACRAVAAAAAGGSGASGTAPKRHRVEGSSVSTARSAIGACVTRSAGSMSTSSAAAA
eukprot:1958676-Prymnesium_polylepis.1